MFVVGEECPICRNSNFTDNWKGRVFVADSEKSEIAKKMGINIKGEYAIKVR